MTKVIGYELRRMLCSWHFLAMLLVNGVYAWYVLTTDIIIGIAYTAPFSIWSHCVYVGKLLPIMMASILLLQANYYGKKQRLADLLTVAAPITQAQILWIRTLVLGVGFFVLCMLAGGLSVLFNRSFFGIERFAAYLLPDVLILLPCFAVAAAIGHLFGKLHPALLYGLAVAAVLLGQIKGSGPADFYCDGFFASMPLELPLWNDEEPAFCMDMGWLLVRLFYLAIGGVLMLFHMKYKAKPTRA